MAAGRASARPTRARTPVAHGARFPPVMAVAATSTGASLPNGPGSTDAQPGPGQHLVGEPGVDQPEIRDADTDSVGGDLDAHRAHHRLDTGLRRHIRAHQRARYHRGDRGHHHRVSAAGLEVRQRGAEGVECTDQVDVDDLAPARRDRRPRPCIPARRCRRWRPRHRSSRNALCGGARRLHRLRRCDISLECRCGRTEFGRPAVAAAQSHDRVARRRAPAPTRSRATCAPIPRAAPVITTTLWLRLRLTFMTL